MEKVLFYFLAFLIVWAPLPLGSSRPWPAGFLETCIAIIFSLWLLTGDKQNNRTAVHHVLRKNRWIVALFWMIPAYTLLQLIPLPSNLHSALGHASRLPMASYDWTPMTADVGATLLQLQKSLALAMLFTFLPGIVNSPSKIESCMEAIVISGVIQACYGMLVVLGGAEFDIFHILDHSTHPCCATGTFVSRNNFAGLLIISMATAIGLIIANILKTRDPYKGWRAVLRRLLQTMMSGKARLRIFLALMVAALILSRSRMGNTAFFASLGISAVIGLYIFRKNRQRSSLFFLFASMIALDFLILGSYIGLEQLAERLEATNLEREERPYVYEAAMVLIRDAMPFGTGGGTFNSVFDAYKSNRIFLNYSDAHNDYLQTGIEYGLPGLILFGMITFLTLRAAVIAQYHRHTAELRGAGFAGMMGIIAYLIYSFTDLNLQVFANAFLLTILCALTCIAYGMEHQQHTRSSGKKNEDH
ncbi:MAG TPA: O-antigen ligase family protein [Fluviicoccus sp.]|nr:O-antigen ligase family protein [Fluviicoccus sp.]